MLQHPTLDQLRHLKLHGMARAFAELNDNPQAGELDHGQWLALLLDPRGSRTRRPATDLQAPQRPPAPSQRPVSRMSITGLPDASTKPSSSNWRAANGSPANRT